MIKVTINEQIYFAPENFEELNFETYLNLQKAVEAGGAEVDMFCALVGIDKHTILEADIDFAEYLGILVKLGSFIYEKVDFDNIKIPKKVYFDKELLDMPKDLGKMPFGLLADAQRVLQTQDLTNWEQYANASAEITAYIMYYCKHKKYDYESAMLLLPKVKKMPFKTVFGIAIFFLKKMTELMSGTMQTLNPLVILKNKLWQAIKRLLRFGA